MKPWLAVLGGVAWMGGCVSSEEAFVGARLQRLCTQAIPVCDVQASCVLDPRSYIEKRFPGGIRLVVRSDADASTLTLRMQLASQEAPGTELVVESWQADCNDVTSMRMADIDLFAAAGDDRIFEWELPLAGRGDHLVELRSDMTADYLITVDVEADPPPDREVIERETITPDVEPDVAPETSD